MQPQSPIAKFYNRSYNRISSIRCDDYECNISDSCEQTCDKNRYTSCFRDGFLSILLRGKVRIFRGPLLILRELGLFEISYFSVKTLRGIYWCFLPICSMPDAESSPLSTSARSFIYRRNRKGPITAIGEDQTDERNEDLNNDKWLRITDKLTLN